MQPVLAEIWIYPVKALDGTQVSACPISAGGALQDDRRFAMVDPSGNFVNGKRNPRVHLIRSIYDAAAIKTRRADLEAELSAALETPIRLDENAALGFPDDTDSPGPTVISNATLETIASWFPGQTAQGIRARLRPNLVISNCPPFWEDQLFAAPGNRRKFQLGEVAIQGNNPCQRCVVPSRDPRTGEPLPEFQTRFRQLREASLPPWANRERFSHFYRVAVNTVIDPAEAGKILHTGDKLILE